MANVVTFKTQQGFSVRRHFNWQLSGRVTASVDAQVANANAILAKLKKKSIRQIEKKYQVKVSLEGRAQEQDQALGDMLLGLFVALTLIYLILAWSFGSYGLPLII